MDVRRTEIGVVHGADTDEPDGRTGLRVVLHTATRQVGQRAIFWPVPLAEGVMTISVQRLDARHDRLHKERLVDDPAGIAWETF